jgi:hypothetical protein
MIPSVAELPLKEEEEAAATTTEMTDLAAAQGLPLHQEADAGRGPRRRTSSENAQSRYRWSRFRRMYCMGRRDCEPIRRKRKNFVHICTKSLVQNQ